MAGMAVLAFAGASYLIFLAVFLYFVGFLAAWPGLPTTIDKGIAAGAGRAVLVDLALVALFAIQHSVMARSGFKAAWRHVVPDALERSIYVLASSAVLALVMALWHPVPGAVWHVGAPALRIAIWVVYALGIALIFTSTWLINHFELLGIAQAVARCRGRPLEGPRFRTPLFYRLVRHPLYTGFLVALWAAPTMTIGHLLFSGSLTLYIVVGASLEERDLSAHFGEAYRAYQRRVGFLLPGLGRKG